MVNRWLRKPEPHDVALWGLVLAFAVFAIYALQFDAMRNANKIARDNLATSQRAFVSFSPNIQAPFFDLKKEEPNDVWAWQFFIPITNSGSTPTRDLWLHAARYSSKEPLNSSFNFHDFEDGERSFIGARDTTSYTTEPLEIEDILATRSGGHVYIAGWAKYQDQFQGTPTHTTKFCYELNPPSGDLTDFSKRSTVTIHFSLCKGVGAAHNCADDECEQKAN